MKTISIKNGIQQLQKYWKDDLIAGFSVSLIALPLCLGIAIASGFPPIAGIFAAIVGGIFVSRFNGSYLTIAGPAAGLIVVNLGAIESLGGVWTEADPGGLPFALAAFVIAGAFILLFGLLILTFANARKNYHPRFWFAIYTAYCPPRSRTKCLL